MRRRKNNKKALLLLLALSFFSFFTVKFVLKTKESLSPKKEIKSEVLECSTCGESSTHFQQNVEEDITNNILMIEEKDTVDVTSLVDSSVLGTDTGGFSCRGLDPANFLSSSRYVCSSEGPGPVDFSTERGSLAGGGINVSKDSDIKITKITYPLAFGLGQYSYIDSNKQIRKKSPDYRSNGQQIDPEYMAKTLSPKESIEFYEEISGTEKEPFQVEGKVYIKDSDFEMKEGDGEGKYQIENVEGEPGCILKGKPCKKEFAVSDYNVGKSNRIASDQTNYGGYYAMQIPGTDKEVNKITEGKEKEKKKECLVDGQGYQRIDKGNNVVCDKKPAFVLATFDAFFSSDVWRGCTIGERQEIRDEYGNTTIGFVPTKECVQTKALAIKMTPIFGEPNKCDKELCANAFLSQTYRQTLSPEESSGVKESSPDTKKSVMFFVATPCALDIDGTQVDVHCLWDASPTLLNYNLQAKDKSPNQNDFPWNFRSYWASVLSAIKISNDNVYKIGL